MFPRPRNPVIRATCQPLLPTNSSPFRSLHFNAKKLEVFILLIRHNLCGSHGAQRPQDLSSECARRWGAGRRKEPGSSSYEKGRLFGPVDDFLITQQTAHPSSPSPPSAETTYSSPHAHIQVHACAHICTHVCTHVHTHTHTGGSSCPCQHAVSVQRAPLLEEASH